MCVCVCVCVCMRVCVRVCVCVCVCVCIKNGCIMLEMLQGLLIFSHTIPTIIALCVCVYLWHGLIGSGTAL